MDRGRGGADGNTGDTGGSCFDSAFYLSANPDLRSVFEPDMWNVDLD